MAFTTLPEDVDKSDIGIWANQKASKAYEYELKELRASALRRLIQNSEDPEAIQIRILDKTIQILEEAKDFR